MEPDADDKRRAAMNDLARLRKERDIFFGLLRRSGADDLATSDRDDPIERIGRRIGRGLAAIAFVGFCIYLYVNYVH